MSSVTTSNEVGQVKRRVKSLAEVDAKKKFINNRWRRLCSVDKCEKQVQKNGLCAQHFTKNKKQQQLIKSFAESCPSSTHSVTEELNTIPQSLIDLATLIENHTKQNTLYGHGELFCFIDQVYLTTSFICHII